jgi:predicted kinase
MLVLVNGPPASGKSTVAAALVARRPLALNLDIDLVRGLLGAWRDDPLGSGLAARRLALAMAATHVEQGHDVVVPQFLAREQFIDDLAAIAAGAEVRFVEVALWLTRDEAVQAFQRRSAAALTQQHRDAAADVERAGGVPTLEAMYDAWHDLVSRRPQSRRVTVVEGDVDGTVARIEAILDEGI